MSSPLLTMPDVVAYWQSGVGLFTTAAGSTPASAEDDPIGRWEDQIGAFDLIQTTDAHRASLTVSPYKGAHGVDFLSGSSTSLANADFDATSAVTAGTWVIAFSRPGLFQSQGIVTPTGGVLGVFDAANLRFVVSDGGFNFATYRDACYHGKAVVAIYDGLQAAADRFRFRLNRTDRSATMTGASPPAVTATVAPGLTMGAGLTGAILEAAYIGRAITTEEAEAIEAYWAETFFDQGNRKVHVLGDSIPRGYPNHQADGLNWPTLLAGKLGSPWTVNPVTITAYQTWQLEPSAQTVIDPDRDEWRDYDFVVLEGGINDLGNGRGVAQLLTDQSAAVANRHAYGFDVIVQTLLPYANAQVVEDMQQQRLDYNAAVVAGDVGADQVFDIGSDPRWLPVEGNPLYYTDLVHLESPGNDLVAEELYRFILATTGTPVPPAAPTFAHTPDDPSTPSVSFSFTDADPEATFECALDGGSYAACTSPKTYSGLGDGSHTFAVRAVNAAGPSSPASFSWDVVVVLPTPSAGTGAALLTVA